MRQGATVKDKMLLGVRPTSNKARCSQVKVIEVALRGSIETGSKAKSRSQFKPREKRVSSEDLILAYRLKARKLARSILRRWHSRIEQQEVESIVDLSLCEAVKRFDTSRGASFMTFFYYHLRGNLIRAISSAANQFTVPLGDVDASGSDSVNSWMNRGLSGGVNAADVADALNGEGPSSPDEQLLKRELIDLSLKACEELEDLERQVIRSLYLSEEQVADVAKKYGYSRCHISRVKKRSLENLFDKLAGPLGLDPQSRPSRLDNEVERQVSSSGTRRARRRKIAASVVVAVVK